MCLSFHIRMLIYWFLMIRNLVLYSMLWPITSPSSEESTANKLRHSPYALFYRPTLSLDSKVAVLTSDGSNQLDAYRFSRHNKLYGIMHRRRFTCL